MHLNRVSKWFFKCRSLIGWSGRHQGKDILKPSWCSSFGISTESILFEYFILISNWPVSDFFPKNQFFFFKNSTLIEMDQNRFDGWIKKMIPLYRDLGLIHSTESIWNQTLVTFLTTWCVFFVNRSIEIAIFKFLSYLKSIDPPNCDGKSFWFTHSPFYVFNKSIFFQKYFFLRFKNEIFIRNDFFHKTKFFRFLDQSEGFENFPKCSWLVITLIPVSYP